VQPPLLVEDVAPWFVSLVAFVFGACWGSFFNVAIYRWPLGMSVVSPPSTCPTCNTRIKPWHNVPIVGYLALRGRTACCGQSLSVRYPVVEMLGGVLCIAVTQEVFTRLGESAELGVACLHALCWYAFAGGLLIATFVDLEHMEIPDEVSLPGTALGLLTAHARIPPGAADAALGAGAGFLSIQVLFVWGYERLTGRRGMGEGDSKLLMMIGAFLGWEGAVFALVAGAMQGLVIAIIALLSGWGRSINEEPAGPATEPALAYVHISDPVPSDELEDGDDDPPPSWLGHLKLPFGPFLALGALEHFFFGDALIGHWLDFATGLGGLFLGGD
jgi:leader peptidase (prepilin peptidase)/N-methyltransferase